MKYTEIPDELIANATALNDEVSSLAKLFSETAFLGDNRNFPHAHYGYLMACMGQIDLMSKCEWGPGRTAAKSDTPHAGLHGALPRRPEGCARGISTRTRSFRSEC